MRDTRALREERGATLKQAKALYAKGRLTAPEKIKFDGLMARARELKEEIAAIERGQVAGVLGAGWPGLDEGRSGKGLNEDGLDPRDFRGMPQRQHQFKTREERDHHLAFMSFLKLGALHMPAEQRQLLREYRDMGSGGQGAYPSATTGTSSQSVLSTQLSKL